jgi:hypothetical protein
VVKMQRRRVHRLLNPIDPQAHYGVDACWSGDLAVITKEMAAQIRADALELINIARALKDDAVTASRLEAIAIAMLKRARSLRTTVAFECDVLLDRKSVLRALRCDAAFGRRRKTATGGRPPPPHQLFPQTYLAVDRVAVARVQFGAQPKHRISETGKISGLPLALQAMQRGLVDIIDRKHGRVIDLLTLRCRRVSKPSGRAYLFRPNRR